MLRYRGRPGLPNRGTNGGGSAPFTPLSLGADLLAWYDFGDAATITGNPSVTAVADKSTNTRNLTGTNSPQWDGSKITFNGTSNYLSRTSAFMYNNGTCEIHAVMKSNGGSAKNLVGEGLAASGNPIYQTILTNATNANDDVYGFIRNDAVSNLLLNSDAMGATVFDDVKKLVSWIDSGSEVTVLVDGVEGSTPRAYVRSGTLTLDRFTIGALVRNTVAGYLAADAWEIVITSLLDDVDRNLLMQYLGDKHGL